MNTFQQQHFTSPPHPPSTLNTNLNAPPTPLKRTRAKRSCDFCRKRKSRCDADASTPCSNCKAWGYTCEFQTIRKKRGPPSVYVDNLEKKCKKMESLLTALTNCSIKDLERNDFQYAGHIQPSSPPNASDSSSDDEEDDSEHDFDPLHEATKDYDSLKYTGQSSAGLKLFNNDVFKSQSTIPWPGRENIVLKLMAHDELMIVRTEKSSTTGKSDMLFDVGLSMRAPLSDTQKSINTLQKNPKKPAKHQLDKMIGMYFSHIHLILPIVNKTKFLEQYHNSSSAGPPSILMQAVLALTFRFAGQRLPDLVKDANEFADTYFRKVMKRLRDSAKSRLCHVQAALLMALYLDMDDGDVESAQWCTVGSAIRMAQDLGLHRSCAKWNLPRSEIETRHRVFYACYVMDRWLGARAGKPLTILDRDFDADMPSPYEITDDSTDTNLGAPIYRSFISLIKLSEILGRVLKALYAPNAKIANTNAGLDDPTILAVFERRLLNWKNSLDEPLDGTYFSKLDKENLLIFYYVVVLLLHRPFNQLSVEKYPSLKSIVAASEKACTDAANSITDIVNQRHYQTSDPAYYYVLCAPSCYVYALFQTSLVYLSNALRTRSPQDIQGFHQSISLLKMTEESGPAPRAVEILGMLASINGLYVGNDTISTVTSKSNSMSEESSNFTTATMTSASSSTISSTVTPPIYSNHGYLEHPTSEPTQSNYVQHRLMNTSIIGGITPDIQQDLGIVMSPSCDHEHLQHKLRREPNAPFHHHHPRPRPPPSQHPPQQQHASCYVPQSYPVYNHHTTPTLSHQRSFSLDQLQSSTHYSHTRSISHDFHTTHSADSSVNNTPASSETPSVPTSLAMNVNSILSDCYPSQNNHGNNNHNSMNSMMNTYRSFPQTPQAYTAAYDPNMNVSNSTLPPASLNWSDWDVYLGHQNQNSSGQQQSQQQTNQLTSSPSQHIQYP
ncbi:unnamed protein product [Mucor circinelloides]